MARVIAAALLIVAALGGAASASTTRDIDVANFQFTPSVQHADAGDIIRWTVSSGTHTITAYSGGSFDHSVSAGDVVDEPFGGGTVRYRCMIHSSFDAQTNTCSGMCGIVTDQTSPDTTPPAATTTSSNPQIALTGRPVVQGTASDDVGVVAVDITMTPLISALATTRHDEAFCYGCPGPQVSWSFAVPQGAWEVSAVAVDAAGNESPPTAPVVVLAAGIPYSYAARRGGR